jgi:hypothetical protein
VTGAAFGGTFSVKMPTRLLSLFLALALFAPPALLGTAWHLCRTMGAVKSECCCAHGDRDPAEQPEIRADCCEVPHASAAPSASALVPQSANLPAVLSAPLDTIFPVAFHASAAPGFAPARARAPPRRVPRFIENCSLLT